MGKRRVLYLSPVVPAFHGNGLAMRAAMTVRAMAEVHRVSLFVIPRYDSPVAAIPAEIASVCEYAVVAARAAAAGEPEALPPFDLDGFDVLHVFRLAMLPYANAILERSAIGERHIDIDDVESLTQRRIAELQRLDGDTASAERALAAARAAEASEDEVLQSFDRIYVCSARDRGLLEHRSRDQVRVLPNAVAIPATPPEKAAGEPFRLMLVGTFGYVPNSDAAKFFCREVVPVLRALAPRAFEILLVGRGAGPDVQALATIPEVRVVGAVETVAPWYEQVDAVLAPLRAGGGTRIKVLEAFAHWRPVVTTTIGIEGIRARDDEHVLIADTPQALADCCSRLMREPRLGPTLCGAGFSLLLREHSPEALARAFGQIGGAQPD